MAILKKQLQFSFNGILKSGAISRTLLMLSFLSFFSVAAQALQSPSLHVIDLQNIAYLTDSVSARIIGKHEVPGMSIAIAHEGKIIFRKNYGQSDVEMNIDVDSSTVFGLSSVSKQFTAAMIMRLVEEGKVSLNDSVTKFLPDYPKQGNTVTIHHLLNHTSGINDYTLNNDELPGWYSLKLSYQRMMALWANRPFVNRPGENFDYCNWGYYLLGQIIERVTGTSWSNYAEPGLLKPLGLNNTLFAHQLRIVSGRAKGYLHQKDSLINVPYRNVETFSAGGGLSSTVDDIVQWTYLLHSGKVVSEQSLEKMTAPTKLDNGKTVGYGYGLYVDELHGYRKIYHGGTFGFGTYVSHYPEEGITIAILSNSTKGRERAEQLEEMIAMAALNIKIADLPLSAADIERYSGVYSYQSTPTKLRELKVFGENGKLMAQFGTGKPLLLRLQGDNNFIPVSSGITEINFEVNQGSVIGLTIHEGAWEITPATKK